MDADMRQGEDFFEEESRAEKLRRWLKWGAAGFVLALAALGIVGVLVLGGSTALALLRSPTPTFTPTPRPSPTPPSCPSGAVHPLPTMFAPTPTAATPTPTLTPTPLPPDFGFSLRVVGMPERGKVDFLEAEAAVTNRGGPGEVRLELGLPPGLHYFGGDFGFEGGMPVWSGVVTGAVTLTARLLPTVWAPYPATVTLKTGAGNLNVVLKEGQAIAEVSAP